MASLVVKYNDIPSYLKAGDFYRSLNSDDSESYIEIPSFCFAQENQQAEDLDQFMQLLRVTIFWILDELPPGILRFCRQHEVAVWEDAILSLPGGLEKNIVPSLIAAYDSEAYLAEAFQQSVYWEIVLDTVSRLDKSSCDATATAAEVGNLRLLKHLHQERFLWQEETCKKASANNQLACLQYAHENGCPWDASVYEWAAQNGHLECMRYAHEQGLTWHPQVCALAAMSGQLECLQFAHGNGCSWDCRTVEGAAQYGCVECLQYALEQGCPHSADAVNLACKEGHLACLQVLQRFGADWGAKTSYHAALYDDSACLQYMRDHGCDWDERTPHQSATTGNLRPLRYALENGCPYNQFLVQNVARGGSLDCLRLVVEEQGLCMDPPALVTALLKGNLLMLQYLVDQGCPYADIALSDKETAFAEYDQVFVKNSLEFVLCVEYLLERGWQPDHNFLLFVLNRDADNCVALLEREGWVEPL